MNAGGISQKSTDADLESGFMRNRYFRRSEKNVTCMQSIFSKTNDLLYSVSNASVDVDPAAWKDKIPYTADTLYYRNPHIVFDE